MSAQQLVQSLAERLRESASVKTVYGEPVSAEGKTVIPVAKVAYGFGGGSGTKGEGEGQEGSGGGGGVMATPVGVVEISQKDTRFIRFGDTKKLVGAIIGGAILGLLIGRRRSGGSSGLQT
jgi:uncharacterized spore protein YtfJ